MAYTRAARGRDRRSDMEENISHDELIGMLSGLLTRSGYAMATAESCTGGMIAASCTDVAGSSAWFTGGIVAYANEIKEKVLGVPHAVIAEHGAVSGEVVMHMAAGAMLVCGTQAAVAVSGVAGPGGGSPEKPVGTVWTAVAALETPGACGFDLENLAGLFPGCIRVKTAMGNVVIAAVGHHFGGDRAAVRARAAQTALLELAAFLGKGVRK